MIRQPINFYIKFALGAGSLAVLVGLYFLLSHLQHKKNPNDATLPNWTQLVEGIHRAVETGPRDDHSWLVEDGLATAKRFFVAIAIGSLGAAVLGLLMGCFAPIEALLAPPLSIFAKVPPTGALAVFFVLSNDETFHIYIIIFGILPVMAQVIYLSIRDVPEELLFKAYTLGASHVEVIWNVILPHILPKLIDAVRLQIGPALVYLIAAEMLVGDEGFGYRIRLHMKMLNMSTVYFYLALLAAFGFAADFAIRLFARWCCAWSYRRS